MAKLHFRYKDKQCESAHIAVDILKPNFKSFKEVTDDAEQLLNLYQRGFYDGIYYFEDKFGKITDFEDLQRAIKVSHSEDKEATAIIIEVKENPHMIQIRKQEDLQADLARRVHELETGSGGKIKDAIDQALSAAKQELTVRIDKHEAALDNTVMPRLIQLETDMQETKEKNAKIQAKLDLIDLDEISAMAENIKEVAEQVKNVLRKVLDLDHRFNSMKSTFGNDIKRAQSEVKDLQRYIQGKLDVLLESDGDLRREMQILSERLSLSQDDNKLLQDSLAKLANKCAGALEESEELRDLLGQMKEETVFVRNESAHTRTRMHCLEGEATDKWVGFSPGVMYFRRWHQFAKGGDVQLSGDLIKATGRGRLASEGVVIGNFEGLVVADGPCRRFGTPGVWSSYYEVVIEEVSMAARNRGTGGLYVGFSLHSAAEIHEHPFHEFDGWLIGGQSKALVCRASNTKRESEIPDTWGVGLLPEEKKTVQTSVKMLQMAMPPKDKGDIKEVSSTWPAQNLEVKDRIGVLFRCNRDGGATMKIAINGVVTAEHVYTDAPPAEAVGFLTPVIRLAGSGKSARLFPGLAPPSRVLADQN
jgi:hypothetical protein